MLCFQKSMYVILFGWKVNPLSSWHSAPWESMEVWCPTPAHGSVVHLVHRTQTSRHSHLNAPSNHNCNRYVSRKSPWVDQTCDDCPGFLVLKLCPRTGMCFHGPENKRNWPNCKMSPSCASYSIEKETHSEESLRWSLLVLISRHCLPSVERRWTIQIWEIPFKFWFDSVSCLGHFCSIIFDIVTEQVRKVTIWLVSLVR